MNKKLILVALSVMMFCSVSYAQNVVKSGYTVIIDCSNMEPRFYSTKRIPPQTTATNSSKSINSADISSPESNAKVYVRFEVGSSEFGTFSTNWLDAVNTCVGWSTSGRTGWRLPTQRELVLIYILRKKLEENGVRFNTLMSWSSTATGSSTAWCVNLANGEIAAKDKSQSNYSIRCIRELD